MKIFNQEFKGLSQNEVLKRIQDGKTHFVESKSTKTYQEIIINNNNSDYESKKFIIRYALHACFGCLFGIL